MPQDKSNLLAVGDSPPTLPPEQLDRVVHAIVTCAIAHAPAPSDALQALTEAVMITGLALGVDMRTLSAYIARAQEEMPPSPSDAKDAKEFVRDCWNRAREIRARTPDVRTAVEELKKKRAADGMCTTCGRSQFDHSTSNAAALRASGVIVCEEFASWSPAQGEQS